MGLSFSAPVGAVAGTVAQRTLMAVTAVLLVAAPLPSVRAAAASLPDDTAAPAADVRLLPSEVASLDLPRGDRFTDTDLALAITPPGGWMQSPVTALNPLSDPPEPVQESARFQLRIQDTQLYATPIPITSGLVADAGALISIGVARVGSDILDLDRRGRGTRELGSVPGFTVLEDEATYDGLHVLTRYLFSRETDRVLVLRAAAPETSWTVLESILRVSIATFTGDPRGANAPAPPPPPPPPAPAPAEPAPDPTTFIRERILERAATLLGLRYVWGGNSTSSGMDCSAYVSWVWSVSRYTTDSIWNVSYPITKDALRAGDALNLTIGRDPARKGHIRIFEAWANAEHSAMWVFEETPPRVVHRVIAYDERYQPIRLAGLSDAGDVRLIPGTPAPSVRPTPVPTRRPVISPTRTPVRTPTPSYRRLASPTPTRTPVPTVRPTRTPLPTRTPIPPDNGP